MEATGCDTEGRVSLKGATQIMPSHYTVIQYVPDPVTGERINVGVAGYADGLVMTRFLINWARVKALAGRNAATLERIEAIFHGVDQDRLLAMIHDAPNSIQFTAPSGSLRSLEETVEREAQRYLVDAPIVERSVNHGDVVYYAKSELSAAITRRAGSRAAKSLIRPNLEVPGRFGINRRFDLGIRNGKPLHAIQALSFSGSKMPERQIEATAFLAEEVAEKVPVTVVVAPPMTALATAVYENARRTLEAVRARVVTQDEFKGIADNIAEDALAHVA